MEVRRKIIRIARRRLRVRKGFTITDEANFVNDLGADSLRSVDLVMEFEDEFKIKSIPDADGERMTTMGKAVDYITWVLNGSQGRNPLDDVEVDPGSGALGSPSMFKDGVGL